MSKGCRLCNGTGTYLTSKTVEEENKKGILRERITADTKTEICPRCNNVDGSQDRVTYTFEKNGP